MYFVVLLTATAGAMVVNACQLEPATGSGDESANACPRRLANTSANPSWNRGIECFIEGLLMQSLYSRIAITLLPNSEHTKPFSNHRWTGNFMIYCGCSMHLRERRNIRIPDAGVRGIFPREKCNNHGGSIRFSDGRGRIGFCTSHRLLLRPDWRTQKNERKAFVVGIPDRCTRLARPKNDVIAVQVQSCGRCLRGFCLPTRAGNLEA